MNAEEIKLAISQDCHDKIIRREVKTVGVNVKR